MKFFSFLLSLTIFCSCSLLDKRRFSKIMKEEEVEAFTPMEHFQLTVGDSGKVYRNRREILATTPGSSEEKIIMGQNDSLKKELHTLEQQQPESYYEEYLKFHHKFASDSERIYFLRLKTLEEKTKYLQLKGIIETPRYTQAERKLAFQSGEILPGMSKDQVLHILGEPIQVDYAGDPSFENERWGYSTMDRSLTRLIYFENGRVEGWEHRGSFR